MRRLMTAVLLIAATTGLGACACRGGGIGPYGGIHPARCWVW